jgi:hypothetical protein
MSIHELIQMYQNGAITPHHLAIESLNLLDSQSEEGVEEVLGALPSQACQELKTFVEAYRPGKMVTNYGRIPSVESICLAKHWLDKHLIFQT